MARMTDERTTLLNEIEAFLKETGMGPVYFGKIAAKNSDLVPNLRRGGDCRMKTAHAVRKFMAQRREEMRR